MVGEPVRATGGAWAERGRVRHIVNWQPRTGPAPVLLGRADGNAQAQSSAPAARPQGLGDASLSSERQLRPVCSRSTAIRGRAITRDSRLARLRNSHMDVGGNYGCRRRRRLELWLQTEGRHEGSLLKAESRRGGLSPCLGSEMQEARHQFRDRSATSSRTRSAVWTWSRTSWTARSRRSATRTLS